MNALSVIGLATDLVGVLLMGVDLARIQRKLRSDARERLASLTDVFEGKDKLDEWLAEIARSSDWRETDYDEGRSHYLPGTFDPKAAQESIRALTGEVANLGLDIARLAKLQIVAAEADQKTARYSLAATYAGLGLICIGFVFQIVGSL